MESIAVVGTGYVGLVTGACFAAAGHDVMCVDIDPAKIAMLRGGRAPIYEAGLEDLIIRNRARLRFTSDMAEGLAGRGLVFLAVGTPTAADGGADLAAINAAAAAIGACLSVDDAVVAVKSTVPVGTNERIRDLIAAALPAPRRFSMASCPEFLREGVAIQDVLRGDRVVIGAADGAVFDRVAAVYRPFGVRILHMDIASAEMVKYAANAFLATRISFVNEIAALCERVGADIGQVAAGIGADRRIGEQFLRAGVGYGGSCFPKDTRALLRTAAGLGERLDIVGAAVAVNERQPERFLAKVRAHYPDGLAGRTAAVWGLAFKPGTDDVRESPALAIARALAAAGCGLRLYDPVAPDNFRAALPDLPGAVYAASAADAARDADFLLLLTEWEEFTGFPLERLGNLLGSKVIFDGRNCFSPPAVAAHGFVYYSIGRRQGTPARE